MLQKIHETYNCTVFWLQSLKSSNQLVVRVFDIKKTAFLLDGIWQRNVGPNSHRTILCDVNMYTFQPFNDPSRACKKR